MTNNKYFKQRFRYSKGKLFWKNGIRQGLEVGGCCDLDGYKKIRLVFPDGSAKIFKRSRIIFTLLRGEIPEGLQVDHLNHKRDDDRIENLRLVTPSGNARNASLQKKSKSGKSGVIWCQRLKKWQAYIKTDGKTRYIGTFMRKEDAILKRKVLETELGFHKNHG